MGNKALLTSNGSLRFYQEVCNEKLKHYVNNHFEYIS